MNAQPTELDFLTWRTGLGLTQVQAAAALGLSRRQVQYYESGLEAVGGNVQTPMRTVELAMHYLAEHPRQLERYRGE